jgi:predicted RNA-binding Zn-ribbon protein involved in translation (DUF1610 family)
MGKQYGLKCVSCDYRVSVTEGRGKLYYSDNVFYGRADREPLLLSLVKDTRIQNVAQILLANGATPADGYGHALYSCPTCNRLTGGFYFKLIPSTAEYYEPDYLCPSCETPLHRAEPRWEYGGHITVVYKDHHADWKCPKCGRNKLKICGPLARWD